jgi:hypothetical protein
MTEHRDPMHGGGSCCGRCAGWPERREQQRRFTQVGTPAFLPAFAVSARRNRLKFGDEGHRIGRPVLGSLGQAGRHQRPQRRGNCRKRGWLSAVLAEQFGGCAAERWLPSDALIEGGVAA